MERTNNTPTYVEFEFDVASSQQGADLPIVKASENVLTPEGATPAGEVLLMIPKGLKPIYPPVETKNFDLLEMLSIVGIQLSKQQGFVGEYRIDFKDFYEHAAFSHVVVQNSGKRWLNLHMATS